jgi:hypothetical protein
MDVRGVKTRGEEDSEMEALEEKGSSRDPSTTKRGRGGGNGSSGGPSESKEALLDMCNGIQ